ncbi:MAG: DUF4133 domain-containing protein [Verrucomicrobiota bacterium]|nr:DUF4133 domain-containing protein [Verrucomicrobiota bacterium]
MSELRLTETNSADDSAGKTWGLEGNLFWYVAGGLFGSIVILLLLYSMWRLSLVSSATIAVVPLFVTLLYVFGLRQGRPAGYDRDLFELWLSGPGFAPQVRCEMVHPLEDSSYV